jgi:hypothetical protein
MVIDTILIITLLMLFLTTTALWWLLKPITLSKWEKRKLKK